jgi:hypothetical protein
MNKMNKNQNKLSSTRTTWKLEHSVGQSPSSFKNRFLVGVYTTYKILDF